MKSRSEFIFEEFLRPLTGNMLTKMLTAHPKGGAFDLAEFKQELESVNIDIIKVRKVVYVAVFGVGRKR